MRRDGESGSWSGARRQALRSATGRRAEELVGDRLAAAGWIVLARNVRVGRSELDIVAVDPGPPPALVVIEVRANRTAAFGPPEERVDRAKLRAVLRGALALRAGGIIAGGAALPRLPLRVDLVSVELGYTLASDVSGTVVRHIRGVID